MKERSTMVWLAYGQIDVQDGAVVLIDKTGVRTHVPVGGLACLLLEPGTRITHAAIATLAEVGCLVIWVGEGGVRLYSAGQPGGARSDRLLYQAKLALDDDLRIKIVRAMYKHRFQEEPPARRSVDNCVELKARDFEICISYWLKSMGRNGKKREYDLNRFDQGDIINQCLSTANHCLYALCEAAILAAGYAPAIGFIHTGKPLSFVYDIADLFKFDTVIPIAFRIAASNLNPVRETRLHCRNSFRKHQLLGRIIPTIEQILSAGGISIPEAHKESVPIAIPNKEQVGDVGHRS